MLPSRQLLLVVQPAIKNHLFANGFPVPRQVATNPSRLPELHGADAGGVYQRGRWRCKRISPTA
jgi:hypothetical protein